MAVTFTDDELDLFNKNGISDDDIQATVENYRSQGLDDNAIRQKVDVKLNALKGAVVTPELKGQNGEVVTPASVDYGTKQARVKKNTWFHPVDFAKSVGKGFVHGLGSIGMGLGKQFANPIRKKLGKRPLTEAEIQNEYGKWLGLPEQGGAYKTGEFVGELTPYFLLPETQVAGLGTWGNRALTFGYQGGLGGELNSLVEKGFNPKENLKDTAIGAVGAIALGSAVSKGTDKLARLQRAKDVMKRRNTPLVERMTAEQLERATTPASQYGVADIDSNLNRQIAEQIQNNVNAEQDLMKEYRQLHSDMVKKYGSIEELKKLAVKENERTLKTGEISEALEDYQNLIRYEKTLGEAKYINNNIKPSATRESNYTKQPKETVKEPITEPEINTKQVAEDIPPFVEDVAEDITSKTTIEGTGTKKSKFIDTVNNSDLANENIVGKINAEYTPISNKETLSKAQAIIDNDMQGAINKVLRTDRPSEVEIAMGEDLIRRLQATGNDADVELAIDIANKTASDLTKAGRTVQAARIWQALTPQGSLMAYQKAIRQNTPPHILDVLDNANSIVKDLNNAKTKEEAEKILRDNLKNMSVLPKNKIIKELKNAYEKGEVNVDTLKQAIEKHFKIKTMTKADEAELKQLAKNIQLSKTDREREINTALLKRKIEEVTPASFGRKVSTVQAGLQLLNPKTILRNIIGNTNYGVLEDVTQSGLAAPIDKLVSKFTGQRSIVPTNLKTQWEGLGRGYKLGKEDIKYGIDTSANANKYDLWGGRTFRNGGIGGAIEAGMNYALRLPDRMAYTAVYDEAIENMLRASGVKNVTRKMIENAQQEIKNQANLEALQRTFQDNSKLAQAGQGLKRFLNLGQDFGLGDIVLKYAKTPSNILQRGIDYSPIGLVYNVGKDFIAPAVNKSLPFMQRQAVMNLSRGLMGTGLMLGGLGAKELMPDIQGQRERNAKLRENLMAQGNRPYSIPIGDSSYTYDWNIPISIPVSAGVNWGNGGDFLESVLGSVNTLAEQPLLSGLQKVAGGGISSIGEGLADTALGAVNSFTPALLRQAAQTTDPYYRDTSGIDKGIVGKAQRYMNMLQSNIPVLSKNLPQKMDITGNPISRGDNVWERGFNAFISPANVSKRPNNPTLDTSMSLYNQTKDSSALYPIAPKSITVDKQERRLSNKEKSAYQEKLGKITETIRSNLLNDAEFTNLSAEEQIKEFDKYNKAINQAIKYKMFGIEPKTYKSLVNDILEYYDEY